MSKDLTAVDFEPLNKSLENLKQILKKKDVIVDKFARHYNFAFDTNLH